MSKFLSALLLVPLLVAYLEASLKMSFVNDGG